MNMQTGHIVTRAIAEKYRKKLDRLLNEHEFIYDQSGHLSLLVKFCEEVTYEIENKKQLDHESKS